jgi:hypothetical protein
LDQKKNQNMTYKCLCEEGFFDLAGDGRNCFPRNNLKGTLIYGVGHRIMAQNLTSNEAMEVSRQPDDTIPSDRVIAIDVDAINQRVYWITSNALYRAAIPQDTLQMPRIQTVRNVIDATGLAYDWLTGNVYWTDSNGIYVSHSNVFWLPVTLILNTNSTFVPGSIIVNPSTGMMFFVNTFIKNPAIFAATMSGEDQQTIISSNLQYPSDLAIDLALGGRVFWTDNGQGLIESCKPDGTDRLVHIRDDKYPLKLDLFAGKLYWTTSSRDQMKTADQLGQGTSTVFISQQSGIGPLRYVHVLKYKNYANNMCGDSKCSLCVLGATYPKCVCPDGSSFLQNQNEKCDVQPPPGYVALPDPSLCVCDNGGDCVLQGSEIMCVCLDGFTGTSCESVLTTTTPALETTTMYVTPTAVPPVPTSSQQVPTSPAPATSTVAETPVSDMPLSVPVSSTLSVSTSTVTGTSTGPNPSVAIISSVSESTITAITGSSAVSGQPTESTNINVYNSFNQGQRDLSIALPVVLISVLLIILILGLIWAYRRGYLGKRSAQYGRHVDDTSSISSYPSSPTSPREPVAFQGGAVQFGNDNLEYANPMYKDMALVLDPPPYTLSYIDPFGQRNPSAAEGYDQKKNLALADGYDQEKAPEFAAFGVTTDSKA